MAKARVETGFDSARVDRTTRPIDLVFLARQTMGDRRLECEVLAMFENQVELYWERVASATEAEKISMGIHTLKGAALGVGAMALAQLAKAAEAEMAQHGRIEEETLADIGVAVSEVVGYIGVLLRS